MHGRKRHIVNIGLIICAGCAVYANSLQVPFVLDDQYIVDYLSQVNIPEHLLHGGFRRIADITLNLNYRIGGLNPPGYHVANIAIHLACSVLFYLITAAAITCLQMSSSDADSAGTSVAPEFAVPLSAALLFALHPAQTQAVTYIIQRYTSLAAMFYLLAVLLFIRSRLEIEKGGNCRSAWILATGSLIAGILAAGSKQIAVTLPAIMVLLEILLFRGRLLNRRFVTLCAVMLLLVVSVVLVKWHDTTLQELLSILGRLTTEDPGTSRTAYLLTEIPVVLTYLRILCLPVNQNLMHDATMYSSFSQELLPPLAAHVTIIAAAVMMYLKSRSAVLSVESCRPIFLRLASLGIIWFYVTSAVESTIFPIRDVIFEHRMYLPSAGFFLAVASVSALVVSTAKVPVRTVIPLFAAVCLALGGATVARNHVWSNKVRLWEDTSGKSPGKLIALASLGVAYLESGMYDKAIRIFVAASERDANFKAYYLGEAMQAMNLYKSRFTTGKELLRRDGGYLAVAQRASGRAGYESTIYNTLALAYEYLGEPSKARNAYICSLEMNPDYDLAWYNLGLLSTRTGDHAMVKESASRLARLNPWLSGALKTLLQEQGSGRDVSPGLYPVVKTH